MISSTRPSLSASAAPRSLPSAIMVSAARAGMSRGRRCVPAAPGMMPSLTSGSPRRVSRSATRKWHDEGKLQAAAKGGAVHGGDHRLRAGLGARDHLAQLRILKRLAELAHVGAGAEGAAPAHDHQRGERRIGGSALKRSDQSGAHRV